MKFSYLIAASLLTVCTSACDVARAQALQSGEWEVTTTRPGRGGVPGTPVVRRHCLSAEAAQQPTLAALAGVASSNDGWGRAAVADGRILLDTTIDTPDRDVRGMPVRVSGRYSSDYFSFEETITFMGYDVRSTFVGRRLGECH
jgi:hypothetical protein